MAPFPETSQHVRGEIEGLVQGEAPGGDLRHDLEAGLAEQVGDRFVLQSVVQLPQRAAERHLSQGEGRLGVFADIGGENEQVVAFGSKRLYETANVGGRPFGAKNRDAEIRCQVRDTHLSAPFEMIPLISFGESPCDTRTREENAGPRGAKRRTDNSGVNKG